MMQTTLGLDAPAGVRLCGNKGCRVWMIDDARPHCEVCQLARAPHLAVRGGVFVLVEGEGNG